jgi:hypothetical protein
MTAYGQREPGWAEVGGRAAPADADGAWQDLRAGSALFPASRLDEAAAHVRAAGLDALLLTPGADLRRQAA